MEFIGQYYHIILVWTYPFTTRDPQEKRIQGSSLLESKRKYFLSSLRSHKNGKKQVENLKVDAKINSIWMNNKEQVHNYSLSCL